MFAVIRTGGKQYRVQQGDVLEIEKLDEKEGKKIVFKEVLLIEEGKKVQIGTPLIEKAQVKAEIVENFKDEKIVIFKKKRRKQYKKKQGHRQELTRVKIDEIISGVKAAPKKPKPPEKEIKKEAPKKPPAKKVAAPAEVKKEKPKKPAVKKEAKKKPEEKKVTKAKAKATKKAPSTKKMTKAKEK